MLDEEILKSLRNAAVETITTATPVCGISDDMFHDITPNLPFGDEELLQISRYLRNTGLPAVGIRLFNNRLDIHQLLLIIAQTETDLSRAITEMEVFVTAIEHSGLALIHEN
jgi:hypothetical protein